MMLPRVVSLTRLTHPTVHAIAIVSWFGKRYYYLCQDVWCLSSGKPCSSLVSYFLDSEYESMGRAREVNRVLTKGVQS